LLLPICSTLPLSMVVVPLKLLLPLRVS
jgi:hypothetical protein